MIARRSAESGSARLVLEIREAKRTVLETEEKKDNKRPGKRRARLRTGELGVICTGRRYAG